LASTYLVPMAGRNRAPGAFQFPRRKVRLSHSNCRTLEARCFAAACTHVVADAVGCRKHQALKGKRRQHRLWRRRRQRRRRNGLKVVKAAKAAKTAMIAKVAKVEKTAMVAEVGRFVAAEGCPSLMEMDFSC